MVIGFNQPEMIGRSEELSLLKNRLENAVNGNGSTVFVAGEAGVGKTRLISELIEEGKNDDVKIIKGWCLAENLQPLMPFREALRNSGLYHLIAGQPPPKVISAYLTDISGLLAAKVERETTDLDGDIFATMLTGVGNFVKDTLSMMGEEGGGLNAIGYGDYTILMQRHSSASMACVIEGVPSEFLIDDMQRILKEHGHRLEGWGGTEKHVSDLEEKISWLITSGKYDGDFLVDDPKLKQENLFDNVLMGIQRASVENPLIIFIDDLQWADKTTLNLLHYLARNTRNNRVLILGTYRPEDIIKPPDQRTHQLQSTLQNMSREDLLDVIEIERLAPIDTKEILLSALDSAALKDDFCNRIHNETEGNPFFVIEVIKLLVEEGFIAKNVHGSWETSTDMKDLDIPSRIYDVIQRRLDRLMDDQREILECASIEGKEFRSEVIGNILDMDRLKLLKNLSSIENTHRLIHSIPNKYCFDHTKITEVLYNGIIKDLRMEYHRIVGDTIMELYKDRTHEVVSELAHHYYKAEDERASEYLLESGNQAKKGYSNDEAVSFYIKALEVAKPEQRIAILENLGDVLSLMGDNDKAIGYLQDAVKTTKDNKAKLLRKIAEVHVKKGEYDTALKVISEAKEMLEENNTIEHSRILFGEGYVHTRKGNYDDAMQLLQKALSLLQKTESDPKDMGNALLSIGNIHFIRGLYTEALEHYEKSMDIMKKLDDKQSIAALLGNIGITYWGIGKLEKALKFHEQSLEIREKIGDKRGTAFALLNMGSAYSVKAELDKALKLYERSLGIYRQIGDKHGTAMALIGVGEIYYHRNNLEKALDLYQRGRDICLEIGEKRVLIYIYCNIAETELRRGDVQVAIENAEIAVSTAHEIGAKSQEGMCHRALGMVHRESMEWDKAAEELEMAKEILKDGGDKDELARLYYEYALLLEKIGKVEKSKEYLNRALDIYEKMGMNLWIEKCKRALN